MDAIKTVSMWKRELAPVLKSKADEFRLMGYAESTPEDIWKCLSVKVWKGDPEKRLYEMAQDILHLSTTLYISYLTVQAYQGDDLAGSIAALSASEG